MKKILIVSDSLRIGGIQKSLLHFLQILDYEKYDVTLFLFGTGFEEKIPQKVKIIYGNKLLNLMSLPSSDIPKKYFFKYSSRKFLAILCRIFGADVVYKFAFLFEKRLKEFDFAISFSNNVDNRSVYFGYNKFVLEKVSAKIKMSWLHVDYALIHNDYNDEEYKKFDKIIAVSEFAKKSFVNYIPSMKDKIIVIPNFLPIEKNLKKQNSKNPFLKDNNFKIVTVGRLDKNKNQIEQLKILKKILKKKSNISLYLIGDGQERKNITDYIKENNLEKNIFLLGYQEDVSPYVQHADLFLSTSNSESFGLAIAEALSFNTVSLIKYYPACREVVKEEELITNNLDEMYAKIIKMIDDEKYYRMLKKKSYFYNNTNEIKEKIENLFDK